MNTKLIFAFTLSLFVLLTGCMPTVTVKGNGDIITTGIAIGNYDRIDINGSKVVINYEQSTGEPSLTITTDKNIFERYDFVVESGELIIKPKAEEKWTHFQPTEFVVTTNSPAIHRIKAGGGVTFNANSPIESDELKIDFSGSGLANIPELLRVNSFKTDLSGSGTVNAANLCIETYEGNISGSGTLVLGGETNEVKLSISGSGKIKAFELQAKTLDCNIAGSGNIEMSVSDKINADIAGSGKIRFKGNPQSITHKIAGSGSIQPAE